MSRPHGQKTKNSMSTSLNPSPINVLRSDFLSGIFGEDAREAWVCHFSEIDRQRPGMWTGGRAHLVDLDAPHWASENAYYSVGVIAEGKPRQEAHWLRTHVITLDDVGEKGVAPEVIRATLGEPSYVMQTSLSSMQWGYLLSAPLTDMAMQVRLAHALTYAFYQGKDPGHHQAVRYQRMPGTINDKASRVAANGGQPVPVYLRQWEPTRRYEAAELAMALDNVDAYGTDKATGAPVALGMSAWDAAAGAKVHVGNGAYKPATMADIQRWIDVGDYMLAAFNALGWIMGEQGNGYYEVKCPRHQNGETHSVDDDRTGWSPERFLSGQTGFKCQHSGNGHDTMTDEDVELELRKAMAPGAFEALLEVDFNRRRAAAVSTFGASPLPLDMLAAAQTASSQAPHKRKWRRLSEWHNVPEAMPRTIASFLARGSVSQIAAQPAIGKSLFTVLTGCALSAERHDLLGEERPFGFPGEVVIIGNEDGADDYTRRLKACMKAHDLKPADMKHEIIVNEAAGLVVALKSGNAVVVGPEMTELGARIRAGRDTGRNTALVIVDTQAASLSGIDENSNSDMATLGRLLTKWAQDADVALLLVHHTNKVTWGGGSASMANSRGSSAMTGSIRFGVELSTPKPEDLERMPETKRGRYFLATVTKVNHGKTPPPRWFEKSSQDLPTDAGGGVIGPSIDVGVCQYMAKPPKWLHADTGDDNVKLLALGAVLKATAAGRKVHRSSQSGSKDRACVVIAAGIGMGKNAKAGTKVLEALLDERLLEVFDGKRRRPNEPSPVLVRVSRAGEAFMNKMAEKVAAITGDETSQKPAAPHQPASQFDAASDANEAPAPVLPAGLDHNDIMDVIGDSDPFAGMRAAMGAE